MLVAAAEKRCPVQQLANSVMAVSTAGAYARNKPITAQHVPPPLLNVGGRKSHKAGVQPRDPKSVNARTIPAAQRRCHTHSACQPASQASKWQVRMCPKQPIVGQKATPPRSTSVEGGVVRITMPSLYGQRRRRCPKARTGHLDRYGSSRIAKAVVCGGHQVVVSSGARGRLRHRGSRQGSGSSSEVNPSRTWKQLWAGLETVNQGCNSMFDPMNGAAHLASVASLLQRHGSTECYTH